VGLCCLYGWLDWCNTHTHTHLYTHLYAFAAYLCMRPRVFVPKRNFFNTHTHTHRHAHAPHSLRHNIHPKRQRERHLSSVSPLLNFYGVSAKSLEPTHVFPLCLQSFTRLRNPSRTWCLSVRLAPERPLRCGEICLFMSAVSLYMFVCVCVLFLSACLRSNGIFVFGRVPVSVYLCTVFV